MNDIPSTDRLIYAAVKGGFQRGAGVKSEVPRRFCLQTHEFRAE